MTDLFKEFTDSSAAEWRKKAEVEIEKSGKAAEQVLRDGDDKAVRAYYTAGERKNLHIAGRDSGEYLIQERISIGDAVLGNKKIITALELGANSLILECQGEMDYQQLLDNVLLDAVDIQWRFKKDALNLSVQLMTFMEESGYDSKLIYGGVSFDPIHDLLISGAWQENEQSAKNQLLEIHHRFLPNFPHFRTVTIEGAVYSEAGASTATEIACLLAHANEYMSWFNQRFKNAENWVNNFQLNVAVGRNYFEEIAKIRALRYLWNHVLGGHGFKKEMACFINGENCKRYLSKVEQELNILRATTAAMSAAVAGCNAIYLHPFKHEADDFSSRITLNIHHLLKEEAYLEAVNNPADGSYLIDNYTDQLATDAWNEFLLIENSGGLLRNLESGALQKRIELQAEEELKTVLSNQKTILGVNKHRRKDEKVNERPEKVEKKEGSFDVKPLKPYRLAAHLNA